MVVVVCEDAGVGWGKEEEREGEGVEGRGRGSEVEVVEMEGDTNNDVFIHIAAGLHLIREAEHLGVRPPASPLPPGFDDQQLLAIEGSPGTRRPIGRSPKNAAT